MCSIRNIDRYDAQNKFELNIVTDLNQALLLLQLDAIEGNIARRRKNLQSDELVITETQIICPNLWI